MVTALAGKAFLEQNDPALVKDRLPYFGEAVMKHLHLDEWISWAQSKGLPDYSVVAAQNQIKNFVKNLPNLKN